MEKIKLNNQIVLMRKHVKQAKVHSINRLVKQVKLLQNRKGTEIQVLKAKRKAERYLQEISLLKKIKPDDVSKLALAKAKNWKELLSQKNSTLEDRCIAILASYGPVQKEVEIFHNSNKDIVSKISDLIKQWEEKCKFQKGSSQRKKSDFKKLQNTANLLKKNRTEGLLNDSKNQSEATDSGNNRLLSEKEGNNLLTKNILEFKNEKRNNESFQKQKLSMSIKSPQDSFLPENVSDELHDGEYLEENKMEIEMSDEMENESKEFLDNDNKKELESYIDNNAGNETKISCESGNKRDSENESDLEDSKSENESDMEDSESENDDSELKTFPENELTAENTKVRDMGVKKLKISIDSEFNSCHAPSKKSSDDEHLTTSSIPMKLDGKGFKTGENKLKAITVLNLDDLRELDEIPVNNSIENGESSEEESTDNDSPTVASQNDPFFLGRDEAISTENKLVDDPKSNNFISMNEIFERKEKSNNHCNYTKNFQKPLNSLQFSSKYSSEFKTEKKFKTHKLLPKYHQDRLHYKNKDSFHSENSKGRFQPYKHKHQFDRDNIKNKKKINGKTRLETYGHSRQNNSNDLYHRNEDNSIRNSKELHKKNDANSKPLHPSWEAKRKQKEMINTSFQGKKVVFED